MLNVQNYNLVSKVPSFKGETKENKKPEAKYYHSNAGLKTGSVYAGIGTAGVLLTSAVSKFSSGIIDQIAKESAENANEMKELSKLTKNMGRGFLIYVPIFIATALGCGAIVDKVINKKNAAFAEKVEKEGKEKAFKSEENADMTFKKNVFYKSNVGKTLGTALGAVTLPLLGVVMSLVCKSKVNMSKVLMQVVNGALGGLLLGAITDNIANNGARKFADMQAKNNK